MTDPDRYSLDLTLELTQGSLHNLGDMVLLCRVWASTYLPSGEPAKALIVLRDNDWGLSVREVRLDHDATDRLVKALRELGLPESHPQVESAAGNITGWQRLHLSVSLNGVAGTFSLDLQYGGAIGNDAQALRDFVSHLLAATGLAEEADRLRVV